MLAEAGDKDRIRPLMRNDIMRVKPIGGRRGQQRIAAGATRQSRRYRLPALTWPTAARPGLMATMLTVLSGVMIAALLLGQMEAASAQEQASALRRVPCWFNEPPSQTATCYRLTVPEQRPPREGRATAGGSSSRAPASRVGAGGTKADGEEGAMTLDLPIVVISSPKDRVHEDPVIYISGGPGDGDWLDADRIAYWWDFLAGNPWLRHRDLILFDQRGVGMTRPRIDCPELEALELTSLSFGNDHQKALEQSRRATAACLARLVQEGHDPGAYTTAASAEDLHDMFQALGLKRWNIYGVSYGTRLALTYMRLHPEDIRTSILDSVYPPQVHFLEDDAWRTDRAFQLLFAACAADTDCHRQYPDLASRLQALVDRLNAHPLQIRHADPEGGEDLQFPLTGETLLTHLFFNLYNRDDIERVPQIIDIFDRNLSRSIEKEIDLLLAELHDRPDWGDAMAMTIDCLEDVPFNDPAKVKANYAASALLHSFADADPTGDCPAWVEKAPVTAMSQPVESALPSLIFSGTHDPVTPPPYAQLAASHLPHSFYVEFPAIGHDVLGNSICAGRVAEAFLDQPDRQPSDPCQTKPRPLVFAAPVRY